MGLAGNISNEDAAQFRNAEVIENLPEAAVVIERARASLFSYYEELNTQIRKAEERVKYLHQQRDELYEFLGENQLPDQGVEW